MPAEWDAHKRCWMGWPFSRSIWRADAQPAKSAVVEIASAIAAFEPVTVLASPELWMEARAALPPNVRVVDMTIDDIWLRDSGPVFVKRPGPNQQCASVAGTAWKFNGWGGIAPGFDRDALVASKILEVEELPKVHVDMVLEGGSIHVDGEGTLLTTEECLLNPNRNPSMSKEQIEATLCEHLGVQKVIWLPKGLYGDVDTSGHVDNFAAFARPGVVLLAWTEDTTDPQYAISAEALGVLEASTDAAGRRLQVIKVPLPRPMYRSAADVQGLDGIGLEGHKEGDRLAGSYINFYIANGGVVVPAFGDAEADEAARAVLASAFPDRRVVSVQSREILLGGGNIHCITCQQPL